MSLKRANAHFSDDLLSSLLNEPIPGQGVFWSSVGGKPYPVSFRALSFEKIYPMLDPDYNRPAGNTYACKLQSIFSDAIQPKVLDGIPKMQGGCTSFIQEIETEEVEPVDVMAKIEQRAIDALKADTSHIEKIESKERIAWGSLKAFFLKHLPENLDDRENLAFQIVKKALNQIYGPQGWEQYSRPQKTNPARNTTYVRRKG